MKKNLYTLLTLLLLAGCSKHDSPVPQPQPLIIKDVTDPLYFKAIPQSYSRLSISFQSDPNRSLVKLYLKQDTSTLGTYDLKNDGNGYYSTVVNYGFVAGHPYKLIVQSSSLNDTALRYTLPDYTHTYLGPFQYEKMLGLTQSLGPRAFDISPSRNTIFISDDINNTVVTKKLSLIDSKIDILNNVPSGLMIRAISDSEFLYLNSGYFNRYLDRDSTVLTRYNVNTGKSAFVDFVSASYGRYSRVIDNHIFVTGPYYTGKTALIDLKDNSKVTYNSIDFRYIGELNYDHLYYKNFIVDPATGRLQTKLSLTDSSGIEYIDSTTQYTIVSKYVLKGAPAYYTSKLSVYSNTNPIYQSDYVDTRLMQIGRQLRISNNRLLFYQSFGYDTTYRIDGYYSLDLSTGKMSLLHCDSNTYIIMDFQLDPHTTISVRADGVYRIKMP